MAAYAALASLAQTTDLNRTQAKSFFSIYAKDKIRSIHDYMDFLLMFLKDYPEKAKRWESKIRDVANETEDIVEFFMLQKMQPSYAEMNPSSVKLEDLLKDVTEKFGLIAGATLEERAADSPAAISSSSSRLAPTGNDAVIGLDDDLMAIKDRLCGQSSKLQVVPIVGMGGIGKTTLARTVYDDPLIMGHFDIRAWLTVSQNYSPQRLRKILLGLVDSMNLLGKQMSGDKIDDDSEIALQVFKNMKSRRYLVVLDDVWDKQVWDDVRNVFPDDNNGSRIMLTTRLSDVAVYPDSDSPLHEMRFMNDSQSWNLLKQKVFTNSNCPPKLEEIGKGIARKCLGLPLAVVLVAGFMSTVKRTRASWQEIAKTVNPVVGRESDEILSLSYTHLPHHLRPCFLFMGGFPEDATIRASRLIKLWVAEGFLEHQNECSKSLEEEAEEYMEDLVERNLVIVTSRKSNGKIKNCSLHDMVRDLCIRKAEEEKFLLVMDGGVPPQGLINERRISFSCYGIDSFGRYDRDNISYPTIRTILWYGYSTFPSFPNWLFFLGSFRLLRVLDLVGNLQKELPSQVFDLFHLRYLALISSFTIPSAISNLVNLQTLIIGQIDPRTRKWRCDKYMSPISLPWEIWRMPQLRHLFFYNNLNMLPHPPDGSNLPLENLQTLSYVTNLVWNEKIVQMIPDVKKLGLVYEMNEEYNLHHLKYLHQLEKLEVYGNGSFSWRGQNPTFPKTLKKLTLVGGGFPWKGMAIFGSLPNLQVLKLLDYACDGETWETADEEFPQLIFLLIDGSHLWQWIMQSSPLPRLKCLVLRCCTNLLEIPQGIGEIPTLELIEVDHCRESLVESAKQIKKDQESCGNYALQVRFHPNELREGQNKRSSIQVQSAEREARIMDVATEKVSSKIRGTIFRGTLEKMRVMCNRVVNCFFNPCRRK